MAELLESDWKYMRRLEPELLDRLCERINAEMVQILSEQSGTPHERYLKAYEHMQRSDRIVADCFNDWRRSQLWLKIGFLLKHDLLTPEEYAGLAEETQVRLAFFREQRF